MSSFFSFVCLFVLIQCCHFVTAADLTIHIGAGSSSLSISPQNLTVAAPAIIRFQFESGNHSVVQGDLDTPCQAKAGGFNSGFMPLLADSNESSPFYEISITDNNPIFYFSNQGKECQQGTVGVINTNATVLGKYVSGAALAGKAESISSTTASAAQTLSATETLSTSTASLPSTTSDSPSLSSTTATATSTPTSTSIPAQKAAISSNTLIIGSALGGSGLLVVFAGLITYCRRNIRGAPTSRKDDRLDQGDDASGSGNRQGRLTGLGIQEVYGWERPYAVEERDPQGLSRDGRQSMAGNGRSVYELESCRWI